jgi:cytochrome c-type biogenesis protein CcmH
MRPGRALALLLAAFLVAVTAAGKDAAPLATDPVVEQRLVSISEELRCLVCQNESLAGSRADLAQDLRQEIRELIRAGKSDQEIMDFMVGRYGDFVRYRPPLKSTTWLLWLGPFVLLVLVLAGLMVYLRNRGKRLEHDGVVALTDEEQARVANLLRPGGEAPGDGVSRP